MKLFVSFFAIALSTGVVDGFVPFQAARRRPGWTTSLKAKTAVTAVEELTLDEIAHKLRLQVFDVDTGVYGLDSKDHLYGIENIRTELNCQPSLGIELTEVAHSNLDHRGLVLVSDVTGNAALEDSHVQRGDSIIGVFVGDKFKESTTGMDYDDTMDVLVRAKDIAHATGNDKISLELNRLVKRAKVTVEVEDDKGKVTPIEALAGDNLRLLLMHNHVELYDDTTHRLDQPTLTGNCGGEAICGTCLVAIDEGRNHLNDIGPQEQSVLMKRNKTWRAACKTVVGADNEEGSTIRVRLHPQNHPIVGP